MANKQQDKEKRRAARLRNNTKRRKEQDELLEKSELDLEDDEVLDIPETLEKDYYNSPMQTVIPGPTSWDEHEAMKMAQEKAHHIREVTWTTQDLVSNILYANMTAEQKSKAIKAVGDGMGKKLKEVEGKMEKELNLDLLELNALIARDSRHMSIPDKVSMWLSKFKTSDTDLSDKTQVRNALSRASEVIEKGGEVDNLSELREAAKKLGIGTMEKSSSAVVVEKDKTGKYRAVMWPSNNFIDWDGDIISEAAHLEYVEWVNKNMDCAPLFLIKHKPGTQRKDRVDFVGYESGFLLMSAPLTDKEAAGLLRVQALTDIGMSHGTLTLERDPSDLRVVTKYRMVEVSDLPLKNAANPFTNFETLLKEAEMSKDLDTKAYLATVLGSEEEADKFIAKAGIKQKALQDAGVESKEKKTETPTAPESPVPQVNVEAIAAQVFERVTKELDVEGLNDYLTELQSSSQKVAVLEALVKELATSREEALAELIEPPAAKTLVWQKARASQSENNVLKEGEEDEKLKKAKPELGWLSETLGVQPVTA